MASLSSKIDTHDKGIKSAISSSQDIITNAIIGVNNHITQQGTTLEDKMTAKGCVKSIQRFGGSFPLNGLTHEYACNAINRDKTFVYVVFSSNPVGFGCTVQLLSNTKFFISADGATSTTKGQLFFQIQLIEFY